MRSSCATGRNACQGSLLEFCPLPVDDPRHRRPDVSAAARILDWRPTTDLDDGLRHTVADFRARLGRRASARPALGREETEVVAVPQLWQESGGKPQKRKITTPADDRPQVRATLR